MPLTDAQKRWQRNYYRTTRQHDLEWLANCERKRQERKAKADPNIEREYYAERYFRFRGHFQRLDLRNNLGVMGIASLVRPRFVFVLHGQRRREIMTERLPKW